MVKVLALLALLAIIVMIGFVSGPDMPLLLALALVQAALGVLVIRVALGDSQK